MTGPLGHLGRYPTCVMIAILSDIHGNLEALNAVLRDARSRGIAKFYCLGDSVGYGPDPAACLEIVQSFDLCLSGNWDYFVANNGDNHSQRAKATLERWCKWTRSQLNDSQLKFLATRPSVQRVNDKTYAHGDPIDTVNGYLFPESIYDKEKMDEIFAAFDGYFHCGHTHIGGVFTQYKFEESFRFDEKFLPESESAILNVGSVGQPRDDDPRSCYLIDHGDSYEFVRVPYDYETTRRKIDDIDTS